MLQEKGQVLCLPHTASAGNANGTEAHSSCPALTFALLQGRETSKAFLWSALGHTNAVQELTFTAFTAGISSLLLCNIPLFEARWISMIPKGQQQRNNPISEHNGEPTVHRPQFKVFPSPLQHKTLQNAVTYLPSYLSYCFFGEHTELAIKSLHASQVLQICLKTSKIKRTNW